MQEFLESSVVVARVEGLERVKSVSCAAAQRRGLHQGLGLGFWVDS